MPQPKLPPDDSSELPEPPSDRVTLDPHVSRSELDSRPRSQIHGIPPSASTTAKLQTLPRPIISPYSQPFLSPSPLNLRLPPRPPVANGAIREAIADYLAAEAAGDVRTVPDTHNKKWYWSIYWRVKELAKFYLAGSKLLYRNWGICRQLRRGARQEGWALSRREERFIEQTRGDLWRLIPCAIVLIVLEELLPLMVLYVPWMIPSTLILPSQSLRIRWQEEDATRKGLGMLIEARKGKPGQGVAGAWEVASMDRPELAALCRILNLGVMMPTFWLRRRVNKRLQ